MRDDVAKQLERSNEAFRNIVWPRMRALSLVGGGRLISVESVTAEGMARDLDALAGVDFWIVYEGRGMRAVANRVQWPDPPRAWNTFTFRTSGKIESPMEWEKRVLAMMGDYQHPHLTIQAYLREADSSFMSAAVAKTTDVVSYVMREKDKLDSGICRRINPADGHLFLAVEWVALEAAGIEIQWESA